MTASGLAVNVSRLVHIYRSDGHDVAALSGVDLTIEPGSTLALLGPSGAGKSTLLSLIAGLERPTAGTITIGSERTDQHTDEQRDAMRGDRIGLVLQGGHRNLLPYLTVRENVRIAQWGTTGDPLDPDEVLDLVGLADDAAQRRPENLRASEAQLAALAVAAGPVPGLLLADEPTASLGEHDAARVIDALGSLNQSMGMTVLVVTHDPTVAASMQRTVTIRDGRVGSQGRDGVELAVVAPDGSLPLPDDVLEELPPGALLRIIKDEDSPRPRIVVEAWTEGEENSR